MLTRAILSLFTGAGWIAGLLGLVVLTGLAEFASRRLRRRGHWAPAGLAVLGGVLLWVIAARVGHLRTGDTSLTIWDGGLSPLWGLALAGCGTALWLARDTTAFRPLVIVAAVGLVTGLPGLRNPPVGDGATLDGLVLTGLDDAPMALDDRQGRPLVLNLWASWCGPCRAEMPMMQRLAEEVEGVDFVFVNQAEDPRVIGTYLATEGLSAEGIAMDPDRITARRYGGVGLPTTVFFSADGRLRSVYVGEIPEAELRQRIALIRAP